MGFGIPGPNIRNQLHLFSFITKCGFVMYTKIFRYFIFFFFFVGKICFSLS